MRSDIRNRVLNNSPLGNVRQVGGAIFEAFELSDWSKDLLVFLLKSRQFEWNGGEFYFHAEFLPPAGFF